MTTTPPALKVELSAPDISAYRQSNVGIDFVTRLDSGKPGPHVIVQALTHGVIDQIEQMGVARKIWETLTQVDRIFFCGQSRHDRENRGAHVGGFGDEAGGTRVHGV